LGTSSRTLKGKRSRAGKSPSNRRLARCVQNTSVPVFVVGARARFLQQTLRQMSHACFLVPPATARAACPSARAGVAAATGKELSDGRICLRRWSAVRVAGRAWLRQARSGVGRVAARGSCGEHLKSRQARWSVKPVCFAEARESSSTNGRSSPDRATGFKNFTPLCSGYFG
jgi:hypothetical protein